MCEERPYEAGSQVPPGYRVETSEVGGAATSRTVGWVSLGIGYGGAYVAALTLPGEVSWLYFPVLGPWVEVADGDQGMRGLIAIDALLQTVGAALVIGGVAAGSQQLVREDAFVARLHVSPAVTKRGGALWFHGSF